MQQGIDCSGALYLHENIPEPVTTSSKNSSLTGP